MPLVCLTENHDYSLMVSMGSHKLESKEIKKINHFELLHDEIFMLYMLNSKIPSHVFCLPLDGRRALFLLALKTSC